MPRHKKSSKNITYSGFVTIPNVVANSDDLKQLSPRATKLFLDLITQYNGYNNGDFSCAISIMRRRGWNSNDQLNKAKKELLKTKLIRQTKQGGMGIGPSLYALTWQPVNDCRGKLDPDIKTGVCLISWARK